MTPVMPITSLPLVFHGQLQASPFAGELFLSDIRPRALETEEDFIAYHQMARPTWASVWMSFPQKSRLLAAIHRHVVETVWDDVDHVLQVCRVPGIRMPVELGHEKIFQVVELAPEIERLESLGESFLSIHEGFVRHPMEEGMNDLRIQWHGARSPEAPRKFQDLAQRLRALGLHDVRENT